MMVHPGSEVEAVSVEDPKTAVQVPETMVAGCYLKAECQFEAENLITETLVLGSDAKWRRPVDHSQQRVEPGRIQIHKH